MRKCIQFELLVQLTSDRYKPDSICSIDIDFLNKNNKINIKSAIQAELKHENGETD